MNHSPTLRLLRCCFFAACVAATVALPGADAQAEVSEARSAYDAAAEAVRTKDLPRAKRAFLLAYIEAPRPIILYNLGLVCRDLGQPDEAVSYFQRYLDDPNVAPDDPLRAEATRELNQLPAPALSATPVARTPDKPEPPPPSATPEQPTVASPPPPANAPVHEPVQHDNRLWNGVSIGIGSVGLAAALGSGVLLLVTPKPSTRALNSGSVEDKNEALSTGFSSGATQQNRLDARTAGFTGLIAGTALLVGAAAIWFTLGTDDQVEVGLDHVRLTFLY